MNECITVLSKPVGSALDIVVFNTKASEVIEKMRVQIARLKAVKRAHLAKFIRENDP
jgi:hypothetical protein